MEGEESAQAKLPVKPLNGNSSATFDGLASVAISWQTTSTAAICNSIAKAPPFDERRKSLTMLLSGIKQRA
ncbi:hypothetical protein ACLKA7_003101 [Drosophila subpalustris]